MLVKLVYGCPCCGKSTYVRNNAGPDDVIYDYDALIGATTIRKEHIAEHNAAHWPVLELRKPLVDACRKRQDIKIFWMTCSWPTARILEILDGLDVEKIFIDATKEECLQRLQGDDSRPDKGAWIAVIDRWFAQHKDPEKQFDTDFAAKAVEIEKNRYGG